MPQADCLRPVTEGQTPVQLRKSSRCEKRQALTDPAWPEMRYGIVLLCSIRPGCFIG